MFFAGGLSISKTLQNSDEQSGGKHDLAISDKGGVSLHNMRHQSLFPVAVGTYRSPTD